jgi:conjugal transfer ATP-binding protein TraC
MKTEEIIKLAERMSFSDYLPYRSYDPATKVYWNTDDSAGYIWECSPQVYAGDQQASALEGLFRQELPDETVIQFILFADSYIDPIIEEFQQRKTRRTEIIDKMVSHISGFMHKNTDSIPGMQDIPLRNFRLLVAVRMPGEKLQQKVLTDVYTSFTEKLRGAFLFPRDFQPEDLLDWLRRFFNDEPSLNNRLYDDDVPLKKQIIFADTIVENHIDYMKTGNKYLRCATVKSYPEEVNLLQTNEICGGIWGGISDASQVTSPFIFTLTIYIDHKLKDRLSRKTEFYTKQPAFGSFAKTIADIKVEYQDALHNIGNGVPYARIVPVFWVWGNEVKASAALARVKRMWEEKGYIMQSDKIILPMLLIIALPFGTYTKARILDVLQRDFPVSSETVVNVLPTQGDFSGAEPSVLFIGRKGQLCGLDIFAKQKVNNSNVFIAAGSGAGKSFLVNYLVTNYYGENALVRIIDIGRSYKKMTRLFGARFLDFDENSNVCLNPFTHIPIDDEDEQKKEIAVIGSMVTGMCFAKTDIVPTDIAETANTLTQQASEWAWKNYKTDANIDAVYTYLNNFPDLCGEEDKHNYASNMTDLARMLAFNLNDFTSNGSYGKWFNGRATFDISSDEFVVLELENLKSQKALWNIITMQIINAVTQDLYLSDRSRKRLIIFDEAYQFIKDGNALKDVISEGYRRARKYGGSFSIITQSILDLRIFGSIGHVIMANSAFKFLLEANDFDMAESEKLINYPPFVMKLLKTIKSSRPKYSELFIDSPLGIGPARLAVNPYLYYLFTSDAAEIAEIEQMIVVGGMTYDQAIIEMARRYRPDEFLDQ